jgi:hypothetical protein
MSLKVNEVILSIRVINISGNIREDELKHLTYSVEFGKLVEKNFKNDIKSFQKIFFFSCAIGKMRTISSTISMHFLKIKFLSFFQLIVLVLAQSLTQRKVQILTINFKNIFPQMFGHECQHRCERALETLKYLQAKLIVLQKNNR